MVDILSIYIVVYHRLCKDTMNSLVARKQHQRRTECDRLNKDIAVEEHTNVHSMLTVHSIGRYQQQAMENIAHQDIRHMVLQMAREASSRIANIRPVRRLYMVDVDGHTTNH